MSPSPTPTPSYAPSPTPTPSDNVQCPVGHIKKIIDSTIVCVSQNQEQNQNQTQNNNQNQNVNNNSNATGGSSSSSSSSSSNATLTVNNYTNPTPVPTTTTYVYYNTAGQQVLGTSTNTVYVPTKGGDVKVISQVPYGINELPRTGLPLAGLGFSALLPIGMIAKRYSKKDGTSGNSPREIWKERQFKS